MMSRLSPTRLILLLGTACAASQQPRADAPKAAVRAGSLEVGEAAPETPAAADPEAARWAALRARLLARHTEDLPDADVLVATPDVASGLAWLARNDELDVVRARAAERLGVLGTASARDLLIGLLGDPTLGTTPRAGAVAGLAHLDASVHPSAREALVEASADADAAVAAEARRALGE